ncbi:MAG: NAD(P)-dependent oxidoreductase [Leptolyngbya sp. SIO1E4]|nr:NAD(P)-dependent oxidoreductase [Leptolyngbya sp. SIO1E4]
MRSLLITGVSGFLGWHACRLLAPEWQVHGTYHQHPIALDQAVMYSLDLTDDDAVQASWDAIKPSAVLHTAAISKVNQCQQDPEGSFLVNVTGAVKLAERCAAAGIPFLFMSTDLVFEGTQAPYTETDRPNPVNHYGQQKAIAEAQILAAYPQGTICRLPLMYGAATPTARCFVQGFLQAIAAGQTLTLFTDEIRTPAEVTDVVQGLRLVLDQGITGIIHLGGPQRLNRYEFGLMMAQAFKLPAAAFQPGLQSSVPLSAPRPQDVSLNSQRAFSLGYAPRPAAAALGAIAAER